MNLGSWLMRRFAPRALALAALLGTGATAFAASPIATLYGTGVDNAGTPLGDNVDDPHYDIVLDPSSAPFPDVTITNDGFPIPPWFANSATSRWIGPLDPNPNNPNQDGNGAPGDWLYQTNFNMAGLDPNNWAVVGSWGTDDLGAAILFNGTAITNVGGQNVTNTISPGFGGPTGFTVNSSLVTNVGSSTNAGINSVIFQVNNGGGPTGLRTDIAYSRAAPAGSIKIPGLFNTGVDNTGATLARNVDDPHYAIVPGPLGGFGPGAIAVDDTAVENDQFPIGPWLRNSATSRWISPRLDGAGNGDPAIHYFQTTFDLTGLDPTTAVITGLWSSDNFGRDILLNGVATGNPEVFSFVGYTQFEVSAALGDVFLPGVNTLTFVVDNAPPGINPIGLRVEGLVAHANAVPEPSSFALVALAGLGLAAAYRRRR